MYWFTSCSTFLFIYEEICRRAKRRKHTIIITKNTITEITPNTIQLVREDGPSG